MQAELQQRRLGEALLESVEAVALVLDMGGTIQCLGRAAADALGEDALGSPVWKFIPVVDRPAVAELLADASAGADRPVDVRLVYKTGTWKAVRMRAARFVDDAGRSGLVVSAVSPPADGTETTMTTQEAAALLDVVRRLFSVNHDIRSPLGAILGNAQLGQQFLGDDRPDIGERLDRIVRMCGRVSEILDGITHVKQELAATMPQLDEAIREAPRAQAPHDQAT